MYSKAILVAELLLLINEGSATIHIRVVILSKYKKVLLADKGKLMSNREAKRRNKFRDSF